VQHVGPSPNPRLSQRWAMYWKRPTNPAIGSSFWWMQPKSINSRQHPCWPNRKNWWRSPCLPLTPQSGIPSRNIDGIRGKSMGRKALCIMHYAFCTALRPFQQRTNTSCYLAIPTHGFTVVLSVFWGTPPAKPLKCKFRPNSSGALFGDRWAEPTGGEPRLSRAIFRFVPGDIIKTSVSFRSQCFAFRCRVCCFFGRTRAIKNPASILVSRV
jgi:hypothetical protein